MTRLDIHQYPYGNDNYGVLLHCPETDETAAIDAGDADAANAALDQRGWRLTHIWITHHHGDHTAGLMDLKRAHDAHVTGPAKSPPAVTGIDTRLDDGDEFVFAGRSVLAIATPGHTLDMINFHIPLEKLVFTGDTLFALGCGRLFEGDAPMMWDSLQKLAALPDDTVIYCSHEYTQANARFAVTIDPDNETLARRVKDIDDLRIRGLATIPSLMALEKATNPFLRAADPAIRTHLDMADASDAEVFGEIRRRKDNF